MSENNNSIDISEAVINLAGIAADSSKVPADRRVASQRLATILCIYEELRTITFKAMDGLEE